MHEGARENKRIVSERREGESSWERETRASDAHGVVVEAREMRKTHRRCRPPDQCRTNQRRKDGSAHLNAAGAPEAFRRGGKVRRRRLEVTQWGSGAAGEFKLIYNAKFSDFASRKGVFSLRHQL